MTHYTFVLKSNEAQTKVRIINTASLFELADALLSSIGFELDHAFGFHSNLTRPHAPNQKKEYSLFADQGEGLVDHDTGVENTEINTVFSEGETLLFHFDYGDDWMFQVTCEKIETSKSRKRKAEILEVKGELPKQYSDYEEEWISPEEAEPPPKNIIAFNPKTGKEVTLNPNNEESDYDARTKRLISQNEKLIHRFASYLNKKKISERTIEKHCSNIDFYGHDYVIHYTDDSLTLDKASHYIDGFLGSWFIRKCMWADEAAIKAYITSFKKFYGWLHETGALPKEIYDEFLQSIKDSKDTWLATMRKYDDPDCDIEDVFSDYF